jgi:hypothetical protein
MKPCIELKQGLELVNFYELLCLQKGKHGQINNVKPFSAIKITSFFLAGFIAPLMSNHRMLKFCNSQISLLLWQRSLCTLMENMGG